MLGMDDRYGIARFSLSARPDFPLSRIFPFFSRFISRAVKRAARLSRGEVPKKKSTSRGFQGFSFLRSDFVEEKKRKMQS